MTVSDPTSHMQEVRDKGTQEITGKIFLDPGNGVYIKFPFKSQSEIII